MTHSRSFKLPLDNCLMLGLRLPTTRATQTLRGLRRDRLKYLCESCGSGYVRRMAGVEFVVTPITIAFRALRIWWERVRRSYAREIDVATRQGQLPVHLQRLLEASDGLGQPAFRNIHFTSASDVSGGMGFDGTRQPSPAFASSFMRCRAIGGPASIRDCPSVGTNASR